VEPSVSAAAERIQAIIDAAAHAASGIRADAQLEARRHVEEAEREADRLAMRRIRLMSELTDSLIERAERMREQSDELVRALEDAMRAVAATVSEPGIADRGGTSSAAGARANETLARDE
jgi:chaperonin GroEL (HSP60 family)